MAGRLARRVQYLDFNTKIVPDWRTNSLIKHYLAQTINDDIPIISIVGFGSQFQGSDSTTNANIPDSSIPLFADDHAPYSSQNDDGSSTTTFSPLTTGLHKIFKEAVYFARIQVFCPPEVLSQALLTAAHAFELRLSEVNFTWNWSAVLVFGCDKVRVTEGCEKVLGALEIWGLEIEESHRTVLRLGLLRDCGFEYVEGVSAEGFVRYDVTDLFPLER